jgi:hypothetical protein
MDNTAQSKIRDDDDKDNNNNNNVNYEQDKRCEHDRIILIRKPESKEHFIGNLCD